MRCRILLAIGWLSLPALVLTSAAPGSYDLAGQVQQPLAQDRPAMDFAKDVAPFFEQYCVTCHGGPKPKAQLDFSQFKDFAAASKQKEVWEKVVAQLQAGEMPPAGKPKPPREKVEQVVNWLGEQFLAFDCAKQRDPGRVTFRRLNRNEYNNTIRDLLGVKFKPADDFPSDDVADVFDNNGDVLSMSPLLVEKYFAAAGKIIDTAFQDPELKKKVVPFDLASLATADAKAKEEAVKTVLGPFLRKAYRRPVTAEELNRFTQFLQVAEKNGDGVEQALQLAMRAALCSPHFLFLVEKDFVIQDGAKAQLIGPHELASRLSYFLWSSMPDDELFAAAENGRLRDKEALENQVRRMLKDARAHALTENFTGRWLQLRTVAQLSPDPKLFPAYSTELGAAMVKETQLFFEQFLKEDRSILQLLDADWTFVNEPLAKHYGIDGIKGESFQKVKLTGNQRLGLLTQGSVLSVTSNPTRTSPVKRGKWILDNILNMPPPPPLPDAGALSEEDKDISAAPLRQRMELHRANPICASCHQRMDPLGFSFENFDAVGAWRTKDGTFDIDPSGELPDGQKFTGAKELVALLKKKEVAFRRCLVEKLLTYALGRGLGFYDRCAVDDICAELVRQDNRMTALILAIVNSDPFKKKRGRQP